MTSHPRQGGVNRGRRLAERLAQGPESRWSRREVLSLGAKGLALAGLGGSLSALLGGCERPGDPSLHVPLARKDSPVTWPIFDDNEPIKSGLKAESGVTLQIYNWVDYLNTQCCEDFCKKYGCSYQITTFNTMSEAISKMQTGELSFDIFFPTLDVIGPLIEAKLLRPLNHSYIPNLVEHAWDVYENPFYDEKWHYTVPYTIYTTGMAWRKDYVHEDPYKMKNAWAMPWQEKYRGRVAILDDYREGICLGLMKQGIYDLNTTSLDQITSSYNELQELNRLVDVLIDNNDYTEVPDGETWIHHAWSGDMATAAYYMPKGVPVDVVGYWFPTDGKGPIANDTITIPTSGQNPVLAHLFLNYMLDPKNALTNLTYTGYMQPIEGITPDAVIERKIIPECLSSTVVLPKYFDEGYEELQLPVDANNAWELAWTEFGGGL